MIRINLASKKQSSSVSAAARKELFSQFFKGKQIDLHAFQGLLDQLNDPSMRAPLVKLAGYLIMGAMAWYGESYYKDMQIQELDVLINEQNTEKENLSNRIEAMKKDQEEKKRLEVDELLFKTKIEAIESLVVKRAEMMKVLVSFSELIPNDVWLSDFQMRDSVITIRGFGTKFEQISDFVQNLGRSDVFADVTLKSTEVSKVELLNGEGVPSFELSLKRKER